MALLNVKFEVEVFVCYKKKVYCLYITFFSSASLSFCCWLPLNAYQFKMQVQVVNLSELTSLSEIAKY